MVAALTSPPPPSTATQFQHINYAQPISEVFRFYNDPSMMLSFQQGPSIAATPRDTWLWQPPMLGWPNVHSKVHSGYYPLCTISDNSSITSSPDTVCVQEAVSEDTDYFSHYISQVKQEMQFVQDDKETPATQSDLRRYSTSSSRPHECRHCPRTFARRHDLERHTRVHTGAKPYICPCCYKAFPRSDARGRHFRNEASCRSGPQVLAFIKENIRSTI